MSNGNTPSPRLPDAPAAYETRYFNSLLATLRIYFANLAAVQPLTVSRLNIDLKTLPTQADLADLRDGDAYVDTTAGDVLKIKR